MLRIPKVRKICVGNPHLNWQPHFHFHKCALRKFQHEQWAERLPAPSLGSHCFLGEFRESKALHFLLHAVGCYRFISLYSWKEGKPKWEIHQMPVGMKKDPSSCLQRETYTIYHCGLWQTIGSLRDDMKQWSLKNTYQLPTHPYPINT